MKAKNNMHFRKLSRDPRSNVGIIVFLVGTTTVTTSLLYILKNHRICYNNHIIKKLKYMKIYVLKSDCESHLSYLTINTTLGQH